MAEIDYDCPNAAFKKKCSKLRDNCPKWLFFRGTDPNTGQEVHTFDCADRWQVRMLMEIAREARSAGAATESFRNMVLELNNGTPADVIRAKDEMKAIRNGR